MPYVESFSRWGGILILGAGLLACASQPNPTPAVVPAVAATTSTAVPVASPTAPLTPAASTSTHPIEPAVQRAFDNAVRAMRDGRVDVARRGFEALIQTHPELGGAHANLGLIHRLAGRLPDAVAALEQAVLVSPAQPVYFNQLGITRRMLGQFSQARAAYESALALDPNYAAAMLNLGILHDMYLGDTNRALELYARYLALTTADGGMVSKWVLDLRNRKVGGIAAGPKEKS